MLRHLLVSMMYFGGRTASLPGDAVHLTLVNVVECIVRPASRIPESTKGKTMKALDGLEDARKIALVAEPTDWENQMSLTTEKSSDLRVYTDPTPSNLGMNREH